jgi:hypothetical protein
MAGLSEQVDGIADIAPRNFRTNRRLPPRGGLS